MRKPGARDATRKARIHRALSEYIAQHGFAPSMDELRQMTGLRSKDTVSYHLHALEADGIIRRAYGISRGIVLLEPWRNV